MNTISLMNNLTTDNILTYADHLSRLPLERFINRFRSMAQQYQQEISSASNSYRMALGIRLAQQRSPLTLQHNRYQTLVRKIEQVSSLIHYDDLQTH